jgi:hypothetical protein
MAVEVKCTSEFRPEEREPLEASIELVRWIGDLPAGAVLAPVTVDVGNQRDPWPVMVGLRANWTETR